MQQKVVGFFLFCPVHTTPSPLPSASHMANALSLFPPTTNPNRRPLVFFSKREIPSTSPSSRWERLCAGSEDTEGEAAPFARAVSPV